MTSRRAPDRQTRSRGVDAVQTLALLDRLYAALGAGGPESVPCDDLAGLLGIERCALWVESGASWELVGAHPAAAPPLAAAGDGDAVERIEAGDRLRARLALAPAPLAPDRRDLAAAVARHLAHALAARRSLEQARRVEALAGAALDRLALGVALVARDGRLLAANRAALDRLAELAAEPPRVGAPLVLRAASLAERFAEFLAAAESARDDRRLATRLFHARDAPKFELFAISAGTLESMPEATAALFVSDHAAPGATPAEVLARLYDLTRAEARLAAELLRGGSLEEIARRLGVRRETVRSHLRGLFAKAGTTRQADLVRRLVVGAAALRWD